MACNLINLATGSTSNDVCSSTTFFNFYIDGGTSIGLGITAFTDSGCTTLAPDGFYVTSGFQQTWGEITGGNGVFTNTGTCYECLLISLASESTIGDVCSSTTFTNFYIKGDTGITLGVSAFTDSNCTNIAPDAYYVTNGYRQTWGLINGGDGVISSTGICYDCFFTGYTLLVPQVNTFVDCCNSGHFFNVIHDLGTFTVGEVYYLNTDNFSGCATVVATDFCYPYYNTADGTLHVDCDTCLSTNSLSCATFVCEVTSYVLDTGGITPYDDTYTVFGNGGYNDYTYFIGQNPPNRFIYFDETKWCLSDTLGGPCLMFGNEKCNGVCPDICNLELWVCTTTTVDPCLVVDFDAIFDCDPTRTPTPTPSITPTLTPTKSPTPTPSSTDICGFTTLSLSGETLPGPSVTPSPTPSSTPPARVCFNDDIEHNIIQANFECP